MSPQPQSASQIKAHKPVGLLIIIGVLSVLLIGSIAFGVTMMQSRNDYRDNVQQKIDAAVAAAVEQREQELEAEFIEREKEPLKTYTGPSQYGTLKIEYPKTWAAYVNESGGGNTPINGYLHPNFVPGVDSGVSFALRFQVLESSYDEELDDYDREVEDGSVTVTPVTLEKVPSVAGSRIDGEVEKDKQGSVVLFPIRDKTIKVSVLSDQFIKDFDNIILEKMSFVP